MTWLFALVGAILGSALANGSDGFFGLAAGALTGWLFGSISRLKARVASLEDRHNASDASALRSFEAPSAPMPRTAAAALGIPDNDPAELQPAEPIASAMRSAESSTAAKPKVGPTSSGSATQGQPTTPQDSPSPRPSIPLQAREPNLSERFFSAIRRWFSEGNLPVKIGMLVLFFGVAALLRYAVDQGMLVLPVEIWFALVAGVAVAGLLFGWRQRERRRVFGLALQGGALGVLLLTVFAAFRLYDLMPAPVALGLIVVLVAAGALLAVLQHALALAVLAFTGGFLAPVLISTGSGNHVALFAYYAVLNAAVFAVAWMRPWRVLNLVGFGFTFVVGSLWGYQYYKPEHFGTVEPFLILFFLFYVGIGVLYIVRQPQTRRSYVDGTLTFGTPLLAFPLQAALLRDNELALAFSALAVAAIYAVLFAWLRKRESFRVQGEAFAGLAIAFATLAIPLALSAQWTASTWALEGAALVWLGLREERRLPQIAGVALQLFAAMAFVWGFVDHGYAASTGELPVLNGRCLGALMLAFAGFFIAWRYERHRPVRAQVWLAFLWAVSWWIVAGLREIDVHLPARDFANALVGFAALTMLLAALLRRTTGWARLGWISAVAMALGVPLALLTHHANDGPFSHHGWAAWTPFLLVSIFALHRLREPLQRGLSIAHAAFLFLLPLLAGLELDTQAHRWDLADGWRTSLTILPLLGLWLATWRAPALFTAPLADVFADYRRRWFIPAAWVLAAWWFSSLGVAGDAQPLPFVPIANPLELTQIGVLLGLWALARDDGLALQETTTTLVRKLLLFGGFLTLTSATLRAVHHVTGLAWNGGLIDSMLAQTSLTVVWSIVGVSAWIAGSKMGSRPLWLAGAVLMGIVLAKLVFVDREHVGNIPGIVSFIAVGLLLTVVGYFAPSPPRDVSVEQTA